MDTSRYSITLPIVLLVAVLLALPSASLAQRTNSSSVAESRPEPDSLIHAAMRQWEVPGLAIVVVRDGEVLLLKGYGTRVPEASLDIDGDTLLQIASNSKTFTAYVFGMLVDDGVLSWDDPVKQFIPEFEVPDPYVTSNAAIDDVLSHRAGLSEVVLGGFNDADYTIEDLLDDVRETDLSERFRARNNYSQFGMAILGEVVQRASGLSWDAFVRQRIFEPLGMSESYTSTADLIKRAGYPEDLPNIMLPAVRTGGEVRPGSWEDVGTYSLYAPAGGIISTMNDMATWIAFRLNDGVHEGHRLISAESVAEIRAPRIPADFSKSNIPLAFLHPTAPLIDVGYGQYQFQHRGRLVIVHNGGWMSSVIQIMPAEGLGIGIFSNAWFDEPAPWASLAFTNGLALDLFDHYIGYENAAWSTRMFEIVGSQ